MKDIIVQKFGGSSVATKEKLEYLNTNYAQMNFSKKKIKLGFYR